MRRLLALALAVLGACTSGAPVVAPPRPGPAAAPSPAVSAAPSPAPAFSAGRALETVRTLTQEFPRREATSAAYAGASDFVAGALVGLGYTVRRQRVPVPSGTVDGTPVDAGTTQNVIGEPPGFDPARPHVVVGGHLDTVPDTPGANDNGSGIAVMLELARLASLRAPRTPAVFVAFGAEERRRRGVAGGAWGSRAYVRAVPPAQRRGIRGAIVLDMIGNGDEVIVVARANDPMGRRLLEAARRVRVPAHRQTTGRFFSDNVAFEEAGVPAAWLWAGDHPTLHSPRDTIEVVERAELHRVGVLAWETLRTVRV